MIRQKLYKYHIIEYEYKTLTNKESKLSKTIHKTNSRLLKNLICMCLKIDKIKYEVKIK